MIEHEEDGKTDTLLADPVDGWWASVSSCAQTSYQKYGFTFPLTLTTVHFSVSFVGALIVIEVMRVRPKAEVDSAALLRWVLPMAAVTSFNVLLGELSARSIPLEMLLFVRAFSPLLTVGIQVGFLGADFSPLVWASMLPVSGGMALAYLGHVRMEATLLLSALGSVLLACATLIFTEQLLQGTNFNLDSINALYYMAPYSAVLVALPAGILEGQQLLHWLSDLLDPLPALTAILVSGFFAFCLNFALFYTIQHTSALTFNVAGNLKMAATLFFSVLLFGAPLTQLSAAGCLVEVLGVGLYGWALFMATRQKLEQLRSESERERLRNVLWQETVEAYLGAML